VKYRTLWTIAGWLLVAAIIWLSVTPSPPDPHIEHGDKLEHVLAYCALMFWFCQLHTAHRTRLAYAIGFAALGVVLEFVQGALDYRTYDEFDMIANAIGVLAGWAVAHVIGAWLSARIQR
jgi:VanZ family protein